jgi:hypothetical protein
MIVFPNQDLMGSGYTPVISAVTFDESNVLDTYTIESDVNGGYCVPFIPTISTEDYDNDGTEEFITSYIELDPGFGNNERVNIVYIEVNNTGGIDGTSLHIDESMTYSPEEPTTNPRCSTDELGKYITSVLVFDVDGSPSNGLETVVGYMKSADDFKMKSFYSDGNEIDDYPEIFDGEGLIVSNPVKISAFTDTDQVDFCVLGYEDTLNQLNLVCASEQTGELLKTTEFDWDKTGYFNISTSYGNWERGIHTIQTESATTEGTNLDELLTPYGIFRLDYAGIDDLVLIFENPKPNTVITAIDVEKVDKEDLIASSSTNLWYIDDKYTNTPSNITYYYVNPCLGSTWKINTSVEVRVEVTDEDSDQVRARAILYDGDSNEIDTGWSSYASSGTTFSFPFIANKTITTSVLTIKATDSENPLVNNTYSFDFSVGANGVEFGDCTTEIDIIVGEEEEEEVDENAPTEDNAITSGIDALLGNTGIGGTLIWLLLMAVVGVSIWYYSNLQNNNPYITLGVFGVVEVLLFIAGVKLGYFGIGMIITLVVLGVILIAFSFRRHTTGV